MANLNEERANIDKILNEMDFGANDDRIDQSKPADRKQIDYFIKRVDNAYDEIYYVYNTSNNSEATSILGDVMKKLRQVANILKAVEQPKETMRALDTTPPSYKTKSNYNTY